MKIKVKGPIVIELTDLEFDTKEMKESVKFVPMIISQGIQSMRGPTNLPNAPLSLTKEELLAFATQMKLNDLKKMIKELQEVYDRRKGS